MSRMVTGEDGRLLELDEDSGEPVWSRATVAGVVGAVLVLAVQLGVDLPAEVQTAVTTLAVLLVPAVAGWWARRKSWSGATVAEVLDVQRRER